jgi:chemotaxis protein methyltransferase CheR
MALAPTDFQFVKSLVWANAHNVLDPQRDYAVESRLQALADREGAKSISELVQRLRDKPSLYLIRQVVESLVNHETTFFRDLHPFEVLRTTVLPELMARRARERSLSILSAACSSGQEAYSIAMTLSEHFPQLMDWDVRILAMDYSQSVLERAAAARYTQIEVNRGLPAPYLVKYFERDKMHWQLKARIRQMVTFAELNLAETWPQMLPMDVVFLRNALIYFDVETKRACLAQVERCLQPRGFLFMGAAETTISLSDAFERRSEKVSCYQLKAR